MGDTRAEGSPLISAEEEALKDRETPRLMKRLIWSVLFLVLLMYITMGHNMLSWPVPAFLDHNHLGLALSQMLLALFVLGINRDFFISGIRSLSQGAPNMDVLVAMGSGISFLWSLYIFYRMTWLITNGVSNMNIMPLYHDQLYFESAAMIPALITVGKLLEALSKGRTTDALKSLMRMAPKEALLLRNGEEIRLPVSEVRVGDIFLVKPGEAVPVDGEILSGTAALDEAALTGESVPVDKGIGDAVRAASINTNGYIQAKATRVGEDTSFAQIIRMVSEADDESADRPHGRQGLRRLCACGHWHRCPRLRGASGMGKQCAGGADLCHHRPRDFLPLCAGACHAGRDHGRKWSGREEWYPFQDE